VDCVMSPSQQVGRGVIAVFQVPSCRKGCRDAIEGRVAMRYDGNAAVVRESCSSGSEDVNVDVLEGRSDAFLQEEHACTGVTDRAAR